MAYLLDSDVFIQAKNLHYGFSFCNAFWAWIDREHAKGNVFSIKKVRNELLKLQDDLAIWVKPTKTLFLDTDDGNTYESLKILSGWAVKNYSPAAQAEFLGSADLILVGYAHAHSHVVVTHEVYASGHKIKYRMPAK